VLTKREKKEQLEWQINEVYKYGKLISYLIYTYNELLDGTRKISVFCRLKKGRNRGGAFGQLLNAVNDNWLETVNIINFRRRRATALVDYITKEDHHYNFYDCDMHYLRECAVLKWRKNC
jgi:hypothetical protein